VDETVQVPLEYVKNGEIVLNVSYDATAGMTLGNEYIEFKARFGGVPREIIVPVSRVMAIYARENGQGMSFPMSAPSPTSARPQLSAVEPSQSSTTPGDEPPTPTTPSPTTRPTLTRVK
jgi:stringent starvation protein B